MIYQILNHLDTAAKNASTGINARIETVNTELGTDVPVNTEILVWDLSKLPTEMEMPTTLIVWEGTPEFDGVSQTVRDLVHDFAIQVWVDEEAEVDARKTLAVHAVALGRFIESLPGNAGILEVRNIRVEIAGWALAGKLYTWMAMSFSILERDTNP